MVELKQQKMVYLDTTLIDKIQKYAMIYGLSFSGVLRLIASDFFLKKDEGDKKQ